MLALAVAHVGAAPFYYGQTPSGDDLNLPAGATMYHGVSKFDSNWHQSNTGHWAWFSGKIWACMRFVYTHSQFKFDQDTCVRRYETKNALKLKIIDVKGVEDPTWLQNKLFADLMVAHDPDYKDKPHHEAFRAAERFGTDGYENSLYAKWFCETVGPGTESDYQGWIFPRYYCGTPGKADDFLWPIPACDVCDAENPNKGILCNLKQDSTEQGDDTMLCKADTLVKTPDGADNDGCVNGLGEYWDLSTERNAQKHVMCEIYDTLDMQDKIQEEGCAGLASDVDGEAPSPQATAFAQFDPKECSKCCKLHRVQNIGTRNMICGSLTFEADGTSCACESRKTECDNDPCRLHKGTGVEKTCIKQEGGNTCANADGNNCCPTGCTPTEKEDRQFGVANCNMLGSSRFQGLRSNKHTASFMAVLNAVDSILEKEVRLLDG